MLTQCPVAYVRILGRLGLVLMAVALLRSQQPPRPPGPPGPPRLGISDRLIELRRKLDSAPAANATARRALQFSRRYLESADRARRSGRLFTADRLAEAADALLHVAEHQQRLRSGGGPKGPPPAEEVQDHLQRVYFRTQQADYFLSQSHDPDAVSFPKWSRDFYELARRAYDRKDLLAADENAKCADEIVKALENLAQAATPAPPPLPPPGPPS
jgi:hypothetical protein